MVGYCNDTGHVPAAFLLPIFAIGLLIGGAVVGMQVCGSWERDSVKAGHAEYVMDPNTGASTWRWKTQTAEATP